MNDGPLIMIVEDEEMLRTSYEIILSSRGLPVIAASNGKEALAKLSNNPDLILLDVLMPVMDGKEFLRQAELDALPQRPKVIVNSNIGDETVRSEMISLGADEFVLKSSLSPSQLLDLVSSMLHI